MKKTIRLFGIIGFTVVIGFLVIGCKVETVVDTVIPDVITSVYTAGDTKWTIQGTGSGTRSIKPTLDATQVSNLKATVTQASGSSSLVLKQGAFAPSTNLSGSGIATGDVAIDKTGIVAGEIEMVITVTSMTGNIVIKWEP